MRFFSVGKWGEDKSIFCRGVLDLSVAKYLKWD